MTSSPSKPRGLKRKRKQSNDQNTQSPNPIPNRTGQSSSNPKQDFDSDVEITRYDELTTDSVIPNTSMDDTRYSSSESYLESDSDNDNDKEEYEEGHVQYGIQLQASDPDSIENVEMDDLEPIGAFYGQYNSDGIFCPFSSLIKSQEPSETPELSISVEKEAHDRYKELLNVELKNDIKTTPTNRKRDLVIGNSVWTETNLNLFFASLTRRSRLRPDLIADDLGNKNLAQVIELMSMFDRFEYKRRSLNLLRHPAARCMSDEWIAWEEQQASALLAKEDSKTSGWRRWPDIISSRMMLDLAKENIKRTRLKGKTSIDLDLPTSQVIPPSQDASLENPETSSNIVDDIPEASFFNMKQLEWIFTKLYMQDKNPKMLTEVLDTMYQCVKQFVKVAVFIITGLAEERRKAWGSAGTPSKNMILLKDVLDVITDPLMCSLLPRRHLQLRSDFILELPKRIGKAVEDDDGSFLTLQQIKDKGKISREGRQGRRWDFDIEQAVRRMQNEKLFSYRELWMFKTEYHDFEIKDKNEVELSSEDDHDEQEHNVGPPSPTISEMHGDEYDGLNDIIYEAELDGNIRGSLEALDQLEDANTKLNDFRREILLSRSSRKSRFRSKSASMRSRYTGESESNSEVLFDDTTDDEL